LYKYDKRTPSFNCSKLELPVKSQTDTVRPALLIITDSSDWDYPFQCTPSCSIRHWCKVSSTMELRLKGIWTDRLIPIYIGEFIDQFKIYNRQFVSKHGIFQCLFERNKIKQNYSFCKKNKILFII